MTHTMARRGADYAASADLLRPPTRELQEHRIDVLERARNLPIVVRLRGLAISASFSTGRRVTSTASEPLLSGRRVASPSDAKPVRRQWSPA